MSIVDQLEAAGETLSPVVRATLVALEKRVQALEPLEPEVARLEARVRELEAQLRMDSSNSSRPPSSDPPGRRPRRKRRSGRKRGGQPGHKGHHRSLLPPERVDHVLVHRPADCRHCGHSLEGAPEVGRPRLHQVVELPPVRAEVTEHRAPAVSCPACGETTRGAIPAEVASSGFGPRLVALAATLTSRFRLSRRDLTAFFTDLLDVPAPSLGTTQAFVDEASAALLGAYREVREEVRASPHAGVDETGWSLRGDTRWLWTAACRGAALFHLGPSRSRRELRRLIGTGYSGVVTSDRWSAYKTCKRRQLCWAHLERNLEGLALRGAEGATFARWGLAECERLFRLWRQVREGELERRALPKRIRPLRARVARLLARGTESAEPKVAAFSRDLTAHWPALWTFVTDEEVEPTNNDAERALRRPVLWRKCSFGSQSGKGLRFVERVLTLTETCRRQSMNVLDYLSEAIVAHRRNAPAPRLLPTG